MPFRLPSSFAAFAASLLVALAACGGGANTPPLRLAPATSPPTIEWIELAPVSDSTRVAHPAAARIDALGAEAMAVLADPSLSVADRRLRFHAMLARELDLPLLARFMLGRYGKDASPETLRTYTETFSDYVLARCAALLAGAGEIDRFEVLGATLIDGGDVLVESRIRRGGGEPIATGWRLRERGGRFVIVDLMVQGLSMAQTQRQEFTAILRANGGRLETLIAALRERMV
ncbi:MAG: phospholipid-binding protein MlaC [Rhodospirillales bacterium]